MSQVFVGRQPLFDRSLDTMGYELLFRSSASATSAVFVDGDAATAQVLLTAITEIGLDQLVGDRLAFVNLTDQFLANPDLVTCLPPDRVVLEILEDVEPTEDVVSGVKRLVDLGYTIALDDFVEGAATAALIEFARVVKYDLTQTTDDVLRRCIDRDHAAGRLSLVERIETHDEHQAVIDAGADYVQGYFFARPATVCAAGVPPAELTTIRLLMSVNDPEASLADIIEVLTQDVSMSVKALKFVNAASAGLRSNVESIEHAAILVGRDSLRSWASLALLASIDHTPMELVTLALIRAKFCELVARERRDERPETFYTAGMLSLLDAMTGIPLETLVDQLALSDCVRSALLGAEGPLTDVLRQAVQLERHYGSIPEADISSEMLCAHSTAVTWATQLMSAATTRDATQPLTD